MIQNIKRGYVTDRALRTPLDKAVAKLNSFTTMFGLAKDLFPTADTRALEDPREGANTFWLLGLRERLPGQCGVVSASEISSCYPSSWRLLC